MKKFLKFLGWFLVVFVLLNVGAGIYFYNTNSFIKAMVNNDEAKLFYFPVEEMEDLSAYDYEEIALQVADTVTVYNYFFQAQTDSVKGTVFFVHGAGGNVSRYAQLMDPLLAGGFQIYAVDWRSFGKSNGVPSHQNVLEDTEAAFRDMMAREEAKDTKLIVLGQSLGGQVAVALTKKYQDQIDALVLDGSAASFGTLASDGIPYEMLKAQAARATGPYRALDDIKEIEDTPKLIIQSKDDKWVKAVRGETLFANAQAPKNYWETEGKHIMTLKNYPEEAVKRIEALINN